MDILTGREKGCKPDDATRAAGWLSSSLKQTRKQFFVPGRPLAEESELLTKWAPLAKRG
jgi:hypothetical protein